MKLLNTTAVVAWSLAASWFAWSTYAEHKLEAERDMCALNAIDQQIKHQSYDRENDIVNTDTRGPLLSADESQKRCANVSPRATYDPVISNPSVSPSRPAAQATLDRMR